MAPGVFLEPSWANVPMVRMLYRAYDVKALLHPAANGLGLRLGMVRTAVVYSAKYHHITPALLCVSTPCIFPKCVQHWGFTLTHGVFYSANTVTWVASVTERTPRPPRAR